MNAVKLLAKALVGLIAVLVVIAVLLLVIVDPNDYRSDIESLVKDSTGHVLKINGRISLSLFPWVGIRISDAALGGVPGIADKPLLSVKYVDLRARLLPLFSKRIEVEKMVLRGVTLNLVRDRFGRTNWHNPGTAVRRGNKTPPGSKTGATPGVVWTLRQLELTRAALEYHDYQSGAHHRISGLALDADDLAAERGGRVRLVFRYRSVDGVSLDVKGRFNAAVTGEQILLSAIRLVINKAVLDGSLGIRLRNGTPYYSFDLAVDRLDLDRWLAVSRPVVKRPHGEGSKTAGPGLVPVSVLRPLEAQGTVRLGYLKAFGIEARKIRIPLTASAGQLKVTGATAVLYGGSYLGHLALDTRSRLPRLSFSETLSGIDGRAVYRFLRPYLGSHFIRDLSGRADFSMRGVTRGSSSLQLLKNLDGRVSFGVRQGRLYGLDIEHTLCYAIELSRGRKTAKAGEYTGFKHLSGKFKITNGIFSGNDLKMIGAHEFFRLIGTGWADAVRGRVDYRLRADFVYSRCRAQEAGRQKKRTLLIRVKGKLSNPEVRFDFSEVIKKKIEEKARDALLKQLQKKGKADILKSLLKEQDKNSKGLKELFR